MEKGARQLRLLVWKDYLLRKRKPITLGGILWATAAMMTLVIVRKNVEKDVFPSCEYLARALPSAGLTPFLQSFVCTINNECHAPLSQPHIPTYENARLNKYGKILSPVFGNESIREVLEVLPSASRLMSTLAVTLDHQFIKKVVDEGFKLSDLFKNPENMKAILSQSLMLPIQTFDDFFNSPVNFENVIEKSFSNDSIQCDAGTFQTFFSPLNSTDLETIANKLCDLTPEQIQIILMKTIPEVDVGKYVKIIGEIVHNLSGSDSLSNLSDMLEAVLRLTSIQNYIPKELQVHKLLPLLFDGYSNLVSSNFSYVSIDLVYRTSDLFEPLFKNTETFQLLKRSMNVLSIILTGFQNTLDKLIENSKTENMNIMVVKKRTEVKEKSIKEDLHDLAKKFNSLTKTLKDLSKGNSAGTGNPIGVLATISEIILQALPPEVRYKTLYYLTLGDRALVGAKQLLDLNLRMEEIMLNVCKRHPEGLKVMGKLGPKIFGKVVDGLADADRIQVLTRKIYHPGQMFCDPYAIQTFLKISREEAMKLKPLVCSPPWKNFIADVIDSFGVYNASKTINGMASIVISETLGKSAAAEFITIPTAFSHIEDLVKFIKDQVLGSEPGQTFNASGQWELLLKDKNLTEIIKVAKEKKDLFNIVLVTTHTALAREVISKNRILETFISPDLQLLSVGLVALDKQMDQVPEKLLKNIKKHLIPVINLILATLNDKDKIINTLTSDDEIIFCGLVASCKNATSAEDCDKKLRKNIYVEFPSDVNALEISNLLCDISKAITKKLKTKSEDDLFFKFLTSVINGEKQENKSQVNWNLLIKTMQSLYRKMNSRFSFIFNDSHDDDEWSNTRILASRLEETLFDLPMDYTIKITANIIFRIMETLDNPLFGLDQFSMWTAIKFNADFINSVLYLTKQFIEMSSAYIMRDEYYQIKELPITTKHLKDLSLNLSPLIRDSARYIASKPTDMSPILSVINAPSRWPCSNVGLSPSLGLSAPAAVALQAAEGLLCAPEDMVQEWNNMGHFVKIKTYNVSHPNEVNMTDHVFRNVGVNFNGFIDGLVHLNNAVNTIYGEEDGMMKMNISREYDVVAAWKDSMEMIDNNNQNGGVYIQTLKNIDTLLRSANDSYLEGKNSVASPAKLWEEAQACQITELTAEKCRHLYWAAIKHSVRYLAQATHQMLDDLLEYFSENSEPDANILQLMGFTKKTGLYILYNKMPQFIEVLVNSYMDQEFMKQLNRALGKKFWDCERLVDSFSLQQGPYSIKPEELNLIKPYVCPSLIHWISMPINENVLLDLPFKSQSLFFNNPALTYKAKFEGLYEKTLRLKDMIEKYESIDKKHSLFTKDWTDKFMNIAKTIITNNSTADLTSDELFQSSYTKNGLNLLYATKISHMLQNLSTNLIKLNETNIELRNKKDQDDLKLILKLIERRPGEMIETFLFFITEKLKIMDDEKFDLLSSMDNVCKNATYLKKENFWIRINERMVNQLCASNYRKFMEMSKTNVNYMNLDEGIDEFVRVLQDVDDSVTLDGWKNVLISFLDLNSTIPGETIKIWSGYARDLGLPSYIQYLNSRLQHQDLIITFLSGGDWWSQLRNIYTGNFAMKMFEFVENSPAIVDHVLNNIANVQVVRLVKDMKFNDTALLCGLDISEYIPDTTGQISKFKQFLCEFNQTAVLMEIQPLRFAAQVYDDDFPKEMLNETALKIHMESLQHNLNNFLQNGVKPTHLPNWITEQDKINLGDIGERMNRENSKIDTAFFFLSNLVDLATIFNNHSSPIPSSLTPWVKQINLQLIKREEYAALICDVPLLTTDEIHAELLENFHWDLALSEIVSGRNYTWMELNKALNEMVSIVRHAVHDTSHHSLDKVYLCLLNTTQHKIFTKVGFYISLGSRVMKLIRSMAPHFKEVQGFSSSPVIAELSRTLTNTIPVLLSAETVIKNITVLKQDVKKMFPDLTDEEFEEILQIKADLNKIKAGYNLFENVLNSKIKNTTGTSVQEMHQLISNLFMNNLNQDYIQNNLEQLRDKEFWSFDWLSKIVEGVERFLWHSGQTLHLLSAVDWDGLTQGRLNSTIDLVLLFTSDPFVQDVIMRLSGIIEELHPILENSHMEEDLLKLLRGINSTLVFKHEVLETFNLKFHLNDVFRDWNEIKDEIQNTTNLTVKLLTALQYSTVDLSPFLTSNDSSRHIRDYICDPQQLASILSLNGSEISLQEISSQACGMSDDQAKKIAAILVQKINLTFIFDMVKNVSIDQIMKASHLTPQEGEEIIEKLKGAADLVPAFKDIIANISESVNSEPLVQSLKRSARLTNVLSQPDFLSEVGNFMCGKPFQTNYNRFYSAIANSQDHTVKVDQKQLESLPTDYCRDLYMQVISMSGGKILWSYAKPLIMGKILYTPNTPQALEILKAANDSFSQVGKLITLVNGFAEGFSSLDEIKHHKDGVQTMQKLLKSSFVRKTLLGQDNQEDGVLSQVDFNQILGDFGSTEEMGEMIQRISQMMDCISMDRFKPVEDEATLEAEAARLMEVNEFLAGVVFLDTNARSVNDKMPTSVKYKIRMDIDNVPTSSRIKQQFWSPGPEANFLENMRYFRGFIQLQDMLEQAIISVMGSTKQSSVKKRAVQEFHQTDPNYTDIQDWAVYTKQMPYPCWTKDDFQQTLYESQAVIVAFFFSLILTVSSIVRNLVWERESGNTDLMCVMGLKRRWHTVSWLSWSLLEVLLTMIALCLVLKVGDVLPRTNFALLLCILFIFGLSITMFCYMISAMFQSASLAAVSAAIFYLISFLPYIIILSLEANLNLFEKLVTSLSMSSGFCYVVLLTARWEVQGPGLQWHNFHSNSQPGETMTAAIACLMLLIDSFLYFLIAWFINRMRFHDTVKTSEVTTLSNDTGVQIQELCKQYTTDGSKRAALDRVSLTLKKGHITTLLGHNGAGKTTLIKILSGMIKPNSGTIKINKQQDKQAESSSLVRHNSRNHIGLCPQSDVLLEVLNAREHLAYYAQLKTGMDAEEVKEQVLSMLHSLGLGDLCEEPVWRLSGGMRRRLAVGLAFIAHPHLVVLDEPSSGVDPVARRAIWSLIVGLKAQRTILLTTHHLDEAELLSDTVIIMHRGTMQATGSPLELKHKYGDGYKLNVTYPIQRHLKLASPQAKSNGVIYKDNMGDGVVRTAEDLAMMNNNVKDLMESVKAVVSNSKIVDVRDSEVEINLPFMDAKGMDNDFVNLTHILEAKKSELKYTSYSMDCSTLEQVFLSICGEEGVENQTEEPEMKEEPKPWDPELGDSSSSSTESFSSEPSRASPLHQIGALLHKRFLHYCRNRWLVSSILIMPAVFVAVAMGFGLIRPPRDSENPMRLTSQLYAPHSAEFVSLPNFGKDTSMLDPGDMIIENLMKSSVSAYNRSIQYWNQTDRDCKCLKGVQSCSAELEEANPEKKMVVLPSMDRLVEWAVETQDIYVEKRYGGWNFIPANDSEDKAKFVVWYNNKGFHSMPGYLNSLNNAILKYKLQNENINIMAYSHPLKLSTEQLSKATLLQHVADVGISVVLLIGFSLVAAGSAVYLVGERTSQQKRLQLLSAVHPVTYWIATLIWDIMVMIVAIILAACIIRIFAIPVYVSRDNLPAICLLLFLYGISSSTLVHILEKLFVEPSLANMIIFCTNVFLGSMGLTILLIIDILSQSEFVDNIRWTLHKMFLVWPQFALGDGLVEMVKNSIKADILARFDIDTYESPLTGNLLSDHYWALLGSAVLFFTINITMEMRLMERVYYMFKKRKHFPLEQDDAEDEDCDVATERYRVELSALKAHYNLGATGDKGEDLGKGALPAEEGDRDVLQALGLRKVYHGVTGKRVAVKNLTFSVKSGECFGLLGENGAGKSTTFKMLTGELAPTAGYIYIAGRRLNRHQLCDGSISYCPQEDALDPLLTLTEHLKFYCKLRGLDEHDKRIDRCLEELELSRYKKQLSSTLSGGNKRKLCTAIALLGNARLVLLDEPTSGMDPGTRLKAGSALRAAAAAGRALLLSSHSLLQCEALCTKAAVTWRGRALAQGAPLYLKQKFGGGYIISIRLSTSSQLGSLIHTVLQRFPSSRLQCCHNLTAVFLVPIRKATPQNMSFPDANQDDKKINKNETESIEMEKEDKLESLDRNGINGRLGQQLTLAGLFKQLAYIATELDIADYAVNQSSLDQVFINFSNSRLESAAASPDNALHSIKLSTLERQYSKPEGLGVSHTNTKNVVTKF